MYRRDSSFFLPVTSSRARSDSLSKVGITGETGLALIPSSLAEVDDDTMERNLSAIEALLELEDVDMVDHNMA